MGKRYLIISITVIALVVFADKIYPKLLYADLGNVDKIVVHKKSRQLSLFNNNTLVKSYPISLGKTPIGHKMQEGDSKTPEGAYTIDWRHPNSSYHIALHISYPNSNDKVKAKERGVNPGGDIMIHGMPNGLGWLYSSLLKNRDWTDGCIAVSNSAIEEIASAVKIGTPIVIEP